MAYRFGEFLLDGRTGTLTGPDGPVALRRRTFRLLQVLLEHAPDLMDRDTLLDEVWGRSALSPNVIPQAISELRQALGDDTQSPRYIETLYRRGYRMVCTVDEFDAGTPAPAPSFGTATRGTRQGGPWVALALTAGVLITVSALWWHETAERRWLHTEALPEIRELLEVDISSAWRRLRKARERVRGDPQLDQLWLDLSLPVSLTSEPEGARVQVRGYRESGEDWIDLGRTPLDDVMLPLAMLRFRVTADGHAPVEAAPAVLPAAEPFHLYSPDASPDGMVFVPPGPVTYLRQRRDLPGFWIDKFEVTNRQFRQFIEHGGYRQPEFWLHTAIVDGTELSWEDLVAHLVDTTGMPGPSTWAMGTYPEGKDDHPVEGVSWFEAAAYAEYAGKLLPTVFHWYRAAGLGTAQMQNFSEELAASNFGSGGTVPVGSLDALGQYGAHDMAGNVAEWCTNSDGHLRHILGGSWMEQSYRFRDPEAQWPLERRPGFGFRLIRQDDIIAPELLAEVRFPDRSAADPVDDATFAIYARQFDFDPFPLDARVEQIDDSHRDWRREYVSFAAGYPGERVAAQIFLPRAASPPYQTVIHYPGGDALLLDSSHQAGLHHVEPFLRSGRAVVYPVYLGTFERKLPEAATGPVSWRNLLVRQVKDMRRTLDYLETRDDIGIDRMALHAVSYGGFRAPYALAVEERFRTAIILSAGMIPTDHIPPEVQLQDYLPRVNLPLLLINGRDDFNFPHQTSQIPFYGLLGTPDDRKQHLVLEWGHLPPHYADVVRAYLLWADRWLGPLNGTD